MFCRIRKEWGLPIKTLSIGINAFKNDSSLDSCVKRLVEISMRFRSVRLFFLQFKQDVIRTSRYFERIDCLNTRACDVIPLSKSKKPLISEMVTGLASTCSDDIFLVNSDIIVDFDAISWVLTQEDFDSSSFSRGEIIDGKRFGFSQGPTPLGFDAISINSNWWTKNSRHFSDIPNVYAEPYWDVAYAIMLKLRGRSYLHNKNALIYHLFHEKRWSLETTEGAFSIKLFESIPLMKDIYADLGKMVTSRKYGLDGRMSEEDIAKEILREDEIFSFDRYAKRIQSLMKATGS